MSKLTEAQRKALQSIASRNGYLTPWTLGTATCEALRKRGLVWTEAQKIAFIESAWWGIPLGTYTYNIAPLGSPYDGLLIDGQQRMSAIQSYLDGEFAVFGFRWSEVTIVDRRVWEMTTIFASYRTETEDEDFLRGYYDLMNFGGTAHKDDERATRHAD